MTEEAFSLPTPDDKVISGLLNRAPAPSDKLIILAHGLGGHTGEHQNLEAARFFPAAGYDVVRFGFHGFSQDSRKLKTNTLKILAGDLNLVCDHFRPHYRKLFVAGHSYGGLAMLFANPAATAFSFWDASFTPYEGFWKHEAKPLPGTPYYTVDWGIELLIGAPMVEEAKALTEADSIALARRVTAPSQVILAGDSTENPVRTALYDALICEKSLTDIPGANHIFSTNETVFDLLKTTRAWFDRF